MEGYESSGFTLSFRLKSCAGELEAHKSNQSQLLFKLRIRRRCQGKGACVLKVHEEKDHFREVLINEIY